MMAGTPGCGNQRLRLASAGIPVRDVRGMIEKPSVARAEPPTNHGVLQGCYGDSTEATGLERATSGV
jgi:hypothetical protein